MKSVKKIVVVFENCEYITLLPEDIGMLLIEDIHESIERTACNSIDRNQCANTCAIEIFPENIDSKTLYDNITAKERLLKYNDITQLNVVYWDDTVDVVFVLWDGENEYENNYQKVVESSLGNIYIVIDEEKAIEDFFDDDYINDEDEVEFRKDMIID